jgi:hypothetical protein
VKRILVAVLFLLVAGVAVVLFLVPGGRAQVQLTLAPAMTRGAADSRVTIVEFSDYQ